VYQTGIVKWIVKLGWLDLYSLCNFRLLKIRSFFSVINKHYSFSQEVLIFELMNLLKLMDPRRSWLGFLGIAGLGFVILFVLLEPEPSRELGLFASATFWTFHIYIPLALAQACQLVLTYRWLNFLNIWVLIGAAGITASALFAPFALALDLAFALSLGLTQTERFSFAEIVDEWLNIAPPVMLVWVGLNAARFLRLPDVVPSTSPLPLDSHISPKFMTRIPLGRRGTLVAISAELHYLRVYTTLGDTLILYSFGTALSELRPDAGLQIHRSHWIDPSFVTELSREGARTQVKLINGVVLPVARSRRSDVAAILQMNSVKPSC